MPDTVIRCSSMLNAGNGEAAGAGRGASAIAIASTTRTQDENIRDMDLVESDERVGVRRMQPRHIVGELSAVHRTDVRCDSAQSGVGCTASTRRSTL
jgi:hypothetical protein